MFKTTKNKVARYKIVKSVKDKMPKFLDELAKSKLSTLSNDEETYGADQLLTNCQQLEETIDPELSIDRAIVIRDKAMFNKEDDGAVFVSIKIQHPYFAALKHFDPDIWDNAETWEDFVVNITNNKVLCGDIAFENSVFADLHDVHIRDYQDALTERLARYIYRSFMCDNINLNIEKRSWHELWIRVPDKGLGVSLRQIEEVVASAPEKIGKYVTIDMCVVENTYSNQWDIHYYDIFKEE